MNQLRKIAGVVWILLALAAGYYCITVLGIPKFRSGKQDDLVFAIIAMFILMPIIVGGIFTFGYYALLGEYDRGADNAFRKD